MSVDVMQFAAPVQIVASGADLKPGFYIDINERDYHADPCPLPSLSASGAKTLLFRSPKAFAWKHPRLRPVHLPPVEETWSDQAVFGTVVHKLVLGRGKDVVEVDAKDWKTNAAKLERADITAVGKVAILKDKLVQAKTVAHELRQTVGYDAETPTEVVLIWIDHATDGTPVWCRAMLDALPEPTLIEDVKVTGAELSDEFVARQIDGMGYDISMAWYRRGLSKLAPDLAGRIKVRLTFVERNETYDTLSRTLTDGELHEPDVLLQIAIDRFAACMTAGHWPGVSASPKPVAIPNWKKRALLDAALSEELDTIMNGDDQ